MKRPTNHHALQRKIHEGSNVVESWNRATGYSGELVKVDLAAELCLSGIEEEPGGLPQVRHLE